MSRAPIDREAVPDRLEECGGIEQGIVGWGDGKPHFDLGDDSNGNVTLVKVKLIRGVHGDGIELLCGISEPFWYIPAEGSVVHVSLPAGLWRAPGNTMITAILGKSPTKQFGTGNAQDAVLDFGPDRRVVIKAGKGVVMSDYQNRYIAVGPETGITAASRSRLARSRSTRRRLRASCARWSSPKTRFSQCASRRAAARLAASSSRAGRPP
jgi:hypothetical protein